jgi:hypothetical protein
MQAAFSKVPHWSQANFLFCKKNQCCLAGACLICRHGLRCNASTKELLDGDNAQIFLQEPNIVYLSGLCQRLCRFKDGYPCATALLNAGG